MTPGRKLFTTTSAVSTSRSARRPVLLGLQVERDAPLVAVQAREHRVVAAVGVLADAPARQVAGPGSLDLDDVGAVVAEHLGAARTHHHLGEVEDPDAAEGEGAGAGRCGIGRCRAAYVVGLVGQPARLSRRGGSTSDRDRHRNWRRPSRRILRVRWESGGRRHRAIGIPGSRALRIRPISGRDRRGVLPATRPPVFPGPIVITPPP